MVSNHIIEIYIKSTSDTTPKWEDIRSGADMNELGERLVFSLISHMK